MKAIVPFPCLSQTQLEITTTGRSGKAVEAPLWRALHSYASFTLGPGLEKQSSHCYWRSGAFPVGGGTAWDASMGRHT